MDRLEEVKNRPRSVSQVNLYTRCPYAYKLKYVDGVWQRPAAWLAQGLAVHKAAELWELSERRMSAEDMRQVFRDEYESHINRSCETTPCLDEWFSSGPYRGPEDIDRRYRMGLEQVDRYLRYYDKYPRERPWRTPDGDLAVELGFMMTVSGVEVRGYIDMIFLVAVSTVQVRDLKTGAKPGDSLQLGTYRAAVTKLYPDTACAGGDYWMAQSGKPTVVYDLNIWTEKAVSKLYKGLDDDIKAERFGPKPSPDNCRRCDVATSCPFAMA